MKLSKEQNNAIFHFKGPALVLAVPGAGKTTVLLNRAVHLIEEYDVEPSKILSITFSKAAANDMEKRFKRRGKSYPVEFSTIHSLAYRILKDYGRKARVNYRLIENSSNEVNKFSILRDIYRQVNRDFLNEDKLEQLTNEISYVKNMVISSDQQEKSSSIENFSSIFKQYETFKRKNNYIDFDDMLTYTYDILSKDRDILEKYRTLHEYIQLDEGQDTSKIQVMIVKLLSEPKNNIFVVADDDQSIYGFRGAYPKWLLDYGEVYPDAKIFFMQKNFRSSKNIVDSLNCFIRRNKGRYGKTLVTDKPTVMPINVVKVLNPEKQYEYIADDLVKHGKLQSAILYRNNLSAIGLIDFFDHRGIPFYLRDIKIKFFNHWLINDITNFIKFSFEPTNAGIFNEIFYKMKGYISRDQVNYASSNHGERDVLDRILSYPGIPYFYTNTLNEMKYDFKRLKKLKPYEGIEFIEYELEYGKYLKESSVKFGSTFSTLETILFYLKEIAKKANTYEEFFHRMKSLKNLTSDKDSHKNQLVFSTIHSAKGLEFDNVYIIDLIDGSFPTSQSIDSQALNKSDAIEEERRLFYVAMSRARTNLTLITPVNMGYEKRIPSRFISEIVPDT